MINAAELLAAHAGAEGAAADVGTQPILAPAPRQFPLAGQAEVRPLADPTRAGGQA